MYYMCYVKKKKKKASRSFKQRVKTSLDRRQAASLINLIREQAGGRPGAEVIRRQEGRAQVRRGSPNGNEAGSPGRQKRAGSQPA